MRQLKFIVITFVLSFLFCVSVKAAPRIDYPSYEVFITINENSTVLVEERITQRFNGVSNGVRRDLTLYDKQKERFCEQNNLTCGGFSRVVPLGAFNANGKKLDSSDGFRTYKIKEGESEYLRFEWQIWNEEYQNNTIVNWSVKYLLFGSINWLEAGGISQNKSGSLHPYFYWNTIPEQRAGKIETTVVQIKFPDQVDFNPNQLEVFTDYDFNQVFDKEISTLRFILQKNIGSYGDFTVAYEFNEDEILKPATINYSISGPALSASIYLDGLKLDTGMNGLLEGIPYGKHVITFKANGFYDYTKNIELEPGDEVNLEIDMERTLLSTILLYFSIFQMVIGILTIPLGILAVLWFHRKYGKDKNMPKTIIPEFTPPDNLPPYLLGSLKDEKVDKKDIVSSIIDLAYRGYIKIIEKGKKKFKLIKLKEDVSSLTDVEKDIFNAIFQDKNEVSLESIKSTFPLKYPKIVSKIYDEMVSKGYFKQSPQKTRFNFFVSALILSGVLVGFILYGSIILSRLTNFPVLFSFLFPFLFFTIGLMLISRYMPSKTSKGSLIFAKVLGFKMYLETAEKYSLQNLKPEDFEKYLSYAIVFGIEKKWAEKFKDIYHQNPSWYEGSGSINDPIIFASMLNSFTTQTVSATVPVKRSSYSGGGWSGGSSFGGFSGGGGGGGSAGGW
ncbi:MAG: hypothetical protein KatS3mg086_064 [Candidatus Dojkabacteria bacterium]|nr:MAG: hypothetical protein KatS3mg086_064 [Candidatus Dojkabacteria bacterium]